jgi:hypothetical protein
MTEYELTRRDALAALAAAGAGGYAAATLSWDRLDDDDRTLAENERATLVAVAETVYPSAVSGVDEFVETFVVGRLTERPDRQEGIVDAIATVDDRARDRFDAPFRSLGTAMRERLLEEMGVNVVDPDPDGIGAARVRFYLVNELLYALYTSPTGGELVGIENPQGYPGGTATYRRGPASE